MKWLQSVLAVVAASAVLQAGAQARPTVDYTDMWNDPDEPGWGISIRQKLPAGGTVDKLFAVWYTYDPRALDPASPGGTGFVPLWLVLLSDDGTWSTPTTYTGKIYATVGTPFPQSWSPPAHDIQPVGTFRFRFTDAGNGVFDYSIVPPADVPTTHPAFGLPAATGSKTIVRQSF